MNVAVTTTLQNFCRRLDLPVVTAKELITYLTVKTLVGKEEAWNLSPSRVLDRLLHAVLLDTAVRSSVEELVGPIHHSEASAQLPDDLKAKRRLASLDAISKFGWEPDPKLWEEPGTLLHTVTAVLHEDGEIEPHKTYHARSNTKDTAADESNDRPTGPLRSGKRARHAPVTGDLDLVIITLTGYRFPVRIDSSRTVLALKKGIENRVGIPHQSQAILVRGQRLSDELQLKEELQTKDFPDRGSSPVEVDVFQRQVGC